MNAELPTFHVTLNAEAEAKTYKAEAGVETEAEAKILGFKITG